MSDKSALDVAMEVVAIFDEAEKNGQVLVHTHCLTVARALLAMAEENRRMRDALDAMGFGYAPMDETIGWRGSLDEKGHPLSAGSAIFHCEFCYQGHEDAAQIAHSDDCAITLARACYAEPSHG